MTLKAHRERAFLTTRELADKAGIVTSTLWRIEKGLNKPHISTMRRIADVLNVHPSDIMEFAPRQERGDSIP
jgi:DNA-binding XRE family transcriptional regulator